MANRLKINRLIAQCKNTSEVVLRDGLCAVQGENSCGKSSLMRILDYIFGGENRFIKEIKQACQWVAADLNLGTNRVLLERSVQDPQAPIKLYALDADGAKMSAAIELKGSAAVSDSILAYLGMPKVRVYTESIRAPHISFRNLWKMMYVDQSEGWSHIQGGQDTTFTPKIKQFVLEILMDLEKVRQYELGVQKAELQKEINLLKTEAANIESFLKYFPDLPPKAELEKRIREFEARRVQLEGEIRKIKQDLATKTQYAEPIREERDQARSISEKTSGEIATIELRLHDILLVANDLKTQMEKNRQLHQARKIFADIPVEHCPRCLSEIEAARIAVAGVDKCYVCEKPYRDIKDENAAFAQNLHLLADEQKEIDHLKAAYQKEVDEKKKALAKLSADVEKISAELNRITSDAISPAMQAFEENMRTLSDVKGEIAKDSQSIKMWVECENKRARLAKLKEDSEVLRLKLAGLVSSSDGDKTKLEEFQKLLFGLLKRMGLIFTKVKLDADYMPVVDGKNFLADEGGSSEKVRIILAYYTALLELSLRHQTNFPGILIFDTPIQHELDLKDFDALCLYWKELEMVNPGKFQILVTGKHFPKDVDYSIGDRRYDRDKGKYTIDLSAGVDESVASGGKRALPKAAKSTVLIVEDDSEMTLLLSNLLMEAGLEVRLTKSVQQALDVARHELLSMTVCDNEIPGISDPAFIRSIHAAQPELPVIILTEKESPVGAVPELEAAEYLTKPFDINLLMARIRATLGKGAKKS